MNSLLKKTLSIGVIIGLTLPLQSCIGVATVDTGYRGFLVRFGQVEGEALPEGIYFYNPITTSFVQMDTRVEKYEYDSETYTKDIQTAKMHVVVNYNLNKAHVGDMYKNVGTKWADKLIPQTVEGSLKAVVGKWNAVDLIANRAQAQGEIQSGIVAALEPKGIDVTRVEITNIDYSKEFENAVERKVVAIQEAEQQQNKTVSIREQANQTVISAKADAEAMKIKSEALSQNANLVQYQAVLKWDGKLPEYMLGGTMPFINLNK